MTTTNALQLAYEQAHSKGCFDSKRLDRAYTLCLDPRTKVLDNAIDVPSESEGFIVIGWTRDANGQARVSGCECQDYMVRGLKTPAHWCKHRIAVALIIRAGELEHPQLSESEQARAEIADVLTGDSLLEELAEERVTAPAPALSESDKRRLEIRRAMWGEE